MPDTLKNKLLSIPVFGRIVRWLLALKNISRTQQRSINTELKSDQLEIEIASQKQRSIELEQHYAELEYKFNHLENKLNETLLSFKINMARVLASKQDTPPAERPKIISAKNELNNDLDAFYIAFENEFRGSAADIRQQQVKYLPFLDEVKQKADNVLSVLDIGCGRGEWLQLLVEHGYNAQGIDLSKTMVDFCRVDGLAVEQDDALSYLAKQGDCSLHVITAFHVIEHISFEELVALFDACLRVLKPGGKVIFETPNPENLTVGAYSFYLDPTHNNPLPPVTIEFMARQRGFSQVDIHRYNPRPEAGDVTPLSDTWFRSAVDFAVIAQK